MYCIVPTRGQETRDKKLGVVLPVGNAIAAKCTCVGGGVSRRVRPFVAVVSVRATHMSKDTAQQVCQVLIDSTEKSITS